MIGQCNTEARLMFGLVLEMHAVQAIHSFIEEDDDGAEDM
jgi:hypothetical protein